MELTTCILIVMSALSASIPRTVGISCFEGLEHKHEDVGGVAGLQPIKYGPDNENSQICHAFFALLPSEFLHQAALKTGAYVIMGQGLLLTDITPSYPVDPPRWV